MENAPTANIIRVDLLGVQVSAINMAQALATIDNWIADRVPQYVCVTPVHSVMECFDRPDLKTIYNTAGLVTPDGMPLVWWLRWHGQRPCGASLWPGFDVGGLPTFGRMRLPPFFYGGAPGVPEDLAARLQERFPGLQVVGTFSPLSGR